jgi:plasmid stabilization system protein ParE
MNRLPVDLHPEAVAEAREARSWYAVRDARAAAGFASALDHAVGLISEAPARWPRYLYETRRVLTRRYPFAVIYRVFSDRLLIVAIAHQHRRPGYWAAR